VPVRRRERSSDRSTGQPRGFIPHAIAERLGLPRSCAVTTYEDIAHLGACGPVFNLARARSLGRTPRGALIGMYGQGAGVHARGGDPRSRMTSLPVLGD